MAPTHCPICEAGPFTLNEMLEHIGAEHPTWED